MSENTQSIGAKFKAKRERLNLSIEDACSSLHLRYAVIESLENDIYPDGKELVFVRGYVRSYANYLKLPLEEILATFDNSSWTSTYKSITQSVVPSRIETDNYVNIKNNIIKSFITLSIISVLWVSGSYLYKKDSNKKNKVTQEYNISYKSSVN